ncbi:hypothetical protein ATANTOWER_006468, partial [Ataeniobius toweri]|nr:hypothetical protein [Ataeniobius toweri]
GRFWTATACHVFYEHRYLSDKAPADHLKLFLCDDIFGVSSLFTTNFILRCCTMKRGQHRVRREKVADQVGKLDHLDHLHLLNPA